MSILQCIPDSFKSELIAGTHVFASDTFKIALYTSEANLDTSTTVYTATGEASGSGYTAGGIDLTGVAITTDAEITYVDWTDVSLTGITITARGGMIYNSSKSNKAVVIIDFGLDVPFSSTQYTSIKFPTPSYELAMLRFK
jgi:expansin (peptidoglycan-binding protein)